MDDQTPPPATPLYSPATTGSSQSTYTLSSLPVDERARASMRTSSSGRVTLVFPPIRKSAARASNPTAGPPFVELPTADLVPQASSSSSSGENRTRMTTRCPQTAPLRLVTDDALTALLGPLPSWARNRDEAASTLEDWVESSKQTIRRDHSPDKYQ
ncbi:hypothetical protein BDV93DRAFT_523621 [Ceratobasidium sp. AG-I]|nr:hypothetical protein BDV93DRAFT_523621 [Ceratobasidium sp. AG-I]